jgi:two-component system alkaline phosphatase synthesis response regulator PhoP
MEKRAFVVEDDDNIREIVKYSLKSCGLAVTGFDDAVSMLEHIGKSMPDVILLDIMLPTLDGLEALKRLKANAETSGIPVILLTARSSEIDKVTGLDLGADDYITKPFGVLELMARVRAVLRHGAAEHEKTETYEINSLRLDTSSHEVHVDGKLIELTLKEFDLLKLLMQNAGKVIRRNALLDDVWGYGYAGETRTLDMHIRSLRQKLNDDAENSRYISTVRGVGYKFNV